MFTVKEAALAMGMTERHVRLLLEQKKLEGRKFGRDWMVLDVTYARKRKAKRATLPPDTYVSKGDQQPTDNEQGFIIRFVGDRAVKVGDLARLLNENGVSKKYAMAIVRAATRARVLEVPSF